MVTVESLVVYTYVTSQVVPLYFPMLVLSARMCKYFNQNSSLYENKL